jgi:uncharacterized protein (TIGR03435 family)
MVKLALLLVSLSPAFGGGFDVATVKPSPPPEGDLININPGSFRNGRLIFVNASLSDCLKLAWGLVSDEQLSGPDWIKSKSVRFDIVAVPPPNTSAEEIPAMLQTLLAERLKLVVHHEQKVTRWLALVVAKNGPKMERPKPDAPYASQLWLGRIIGSNMTMLSLARFISRSERNTVLDQTGLTGAWSVRLEWSPPDASATGPSIFTAVEEQLGLRLESRRGPLDVLVVDHADQTPSEN